MPCSKCQSSNQNYNPCTYSDYAQVTEDNVCTGENVPQSLINGTCYFRKADEFTVCCDPNGVCGYYKKTDRNLFWPEFAHPRWLPCSDLYSG